MFDLTVMPGMPVIRQRLHAAQRSIDQGMIDLANQLAPVLRGLILEDYETKAAGGVGRDGVKWKPLSQSTKNAKSNDYIGIETGKLESSLSVRFGGSADLVAEFTSLYAEFFDEERPLLPDEMPDYWTAELEAGALEWAEQRIERELKSLA